MKACISARTICQSSARGGWLTPTMFSSNTRVIPGAVAPRAAFGALARIAALPGHTFLVDDVDLSSSDLVARERVVGQRQVTDAHLLAIAMRHGCRLATFGRGILDLVPADRTPEDVVVLLPASS